MRKKGAEVTSLAVLVLICALSVSGMAAEYDSIAGYEDLLKNQTLLIESFQNLLKNTTLNSSMSYTFIYSFDDLAVRQQKGLYSFEDVVSYNWTELTIAEKINLTRGFEDLLGREAVILTSNEDLLKGAFCQLEPDDKKELLDSFESKLKREVILIKKFEDWLHYQQMIEGTEYETWVGFLASFEDLIRRQSNLLDSFEMLLKIDCSETYVNITKSAQPLDAVAGAPVVYTYVVTANNVYPIKDVVVKDSIWGDIGTNALLTPGTPWTFTVTKQLSCADCNQCMCKVCNFATACGEVITANGNFTVCDVSNSVCLTVDENFGVAPGPYPVPQMTKTADVSTPAAEQAAAEETGKVIVEVTKVPVEKSVSSGCTACSKK